MYRSFEFVEKLNSLNVQIHENSMENQWMYEIVKIQWKIVYIRCIDSPDLVRNLISLKVQNHENSMENYVH